MVVYVLDAYALVAIQSLCASELDIRQCLNAMTDNVKDGVLTFPERVVKHCKSFDPDGAGYMWAHACSGHRETTDVPDSNIGLIMMNNPDIIPEERDSKLDSDLDATPVDVLALALGIKDQGNTAIIISGEPSSMPDRESLALVAPQFGISVMTLQNYMIAEGLDHHLAA